MSGQIAKRKAEHVSICLNQDVNYQKLTTGFEKIQLSHCALPELDFEEINTQIPFLGKVLSFPLIITGMTGVNTCISTHLHRDPLSQLSEENRLLVLKWPSAPLFRAGLLPMNSFLLATRD